MKTLFAVFCFLPLSVFAQFQDVLIYWDAAKTDTQAAIRGTDSLVSQSFMVFPDMTMQVHVQAGDTAAVLDSSKVRIYAQYALADNAVLYTYAWCGEDSIGLDSTFWDKSDGGFDGQPGVDISPSCPAYWARIIAKGLSTNSKAAGDSTKFSVHVLRFMLP